ncbi:MAG: ABC transporter permease [Candidatus Eremiobacteraeota bacterium]|nr:ABC transporter permease [Candidatus Eremiobacteraeota bacterium]
MAYKENPVYLTSEKLAQPRLAWLSGLSILRIACCFAVPALALRLMQLCSCTVFTVASAALILLSVLLIGSTALTSMSGEREKKTIDSLRLTCLDPGAVISGKLLPEFMALCRLLLAVSPTILLLGLTSEYGFSGAMAVLLIAFLSGCVSLLGGFLISSLSRSSSQAIVLGWILKLLWVLGTPLLDLVLSAVFVTGSMPPVFSSVSPLVALYALVLPQAMNGAWMILPWSFFLLVPLFLCMIWHFSVTVYEQGGPSWVYLRRKATDVFLKGWGPKWFYDAFPGAVQYLRNPAFLREISYQIRHGAGRLPGYLVFIVLFLAPYLYARSWALCNFENPRAQPRNTSFVVSAPASSDPGNSSQLSIKPVIRTYQGTVFTLSRHTLIGCLRWTMYKSAGIPLPKKLVKEEPVAYRTHAQHYGSSPVAGTGSAMLTEKPSNTRTASLSRDEYLAVNQETIRCGLIGAIWLFLLYISIRGCCFTVSSVTGEKERRVWDDLALSGMTPIRLFTGKILGALILPLIQMTVVFPVLLFFVVTGNLHFMEVVSFYLYSVLLLIASAVLGFRASATSATSNEAHSKGLKYIFLAFFIVPLIAPLFMAISVLLTPALLLFIMVTLLLAKKNTNLPKILTAFGICFFTLFAVWAVSPLTAPFTFMPSLLNNPAFSSLNIPTVPLLALAVCLLFLGLITYLFAAQGIGSLADPSQKEVLRACPLPSKTPEGFLAEAGLGVRQGRNEGAF